ncbi:serine/threonine-protein kinase [Ramlibacter sp. WS9]|uniref:serine/threonine protein kinase n=1 Tax=Ramlibacter sp. WS9 TaxID=1882741 RepID=UPI001144672E|nr:serine/threonine-protein kinase [Ramlibacter sp. WS9]ROZ76082.1 serine/threonine protein kinase [Ramlibacter sp. WS9]
MNKLGKYQIRRILGKGAMGIVYEGFDPVIERTVAIKTILPSQLNGDEVVSVMARFKREAQAAGRLNHPGIVAIYEYGEEVAEDISDEEATMMAVPLKSTQRVAFIAMEFVKGHELRDLFEKNERFAMPEVARIMTEMLEALDHAHSQGVVHRDMKPANLILLENGRVKVADFGIARVEKSELTQTGTVMGTPSYMSPEQFMGHPVDGRSDLFSCGVILYQMLTGEKPFTGESTTTVMYKVLREDPVPPSQLNLTLPPGLDAVVQKALAKNPSGRFQTGREFAQALQAAVSGESETVRAAAASPSVVPRAASAPIAAAAPQRTREAAEIPEIVINAPTPARSRAAGFWAAGAAAVVAIGAVGYLALGPGKQGGTSVAQSGTAPAAAPAATPVAAAPAVATPVSAAPAEAGTMVISALGLADPQDARFKGDIGAAQQEARNDAKRQLVEKAVALYVEKSSLDGNYNLLQAKLLSNSGAFIRSVVQEGTPAAGKDGLVEMQTRAVVSLRDVQKSLNQLSREERVDFIRNKGDPRISIRIDIGSAEGAAIGRERSQLAENVVKDRIKSFGFRVWSGEGDNPKAANAQQADFAIKGEVKVKQLSTRLQASGLTISKTALTSWTIKAIDVATGEEVYLSTRLPAGQSWGSEDQALADIGKLVGDEFSRNFFLQHFNFRTQKTSLIVTGLPEGGSPLLLRELRGMRAVLDAQQLAEPGRFQIQLSEGSVTDQIQDAVVRPLNAKLGAECFSLAGTTGPEVTVAYSASCATPQMRSKLEGGPPAGWKFQPKGKTA